MTNELHPATSTSRPSNRHDSHGLGAVDISRHGSPRDVSVSTGLDLDLSGMAWHAGDRPGFPEQMPYDSSFLDDLVAPPPHIKYMHEPEWAVGADYDYSGTSGFQYQGATNGLAEELACHTPSSPYGGMPSYMPESPMNTISPQLGLRKESYLRYDSPMSVGNGIIPMGINSVLYDEPWHAGSVGSSNDLGPDDTSVFSQYTYLTSTSLEDQRSSSRATASIASSTPSAHSEKPYACPQQNCNIQFKHSADISRHLRTMHQEPGGGFRCAVEGCSKADKIWTRLDSFKNHVSKRHLGADVNDMVRRSTRTSHGLPVSVMTPAIMSKRSPSDRRARSRLSISLKPNS